MSIYSGFATRQQQQRYNEYLQALLTVLLKRIIKFYTLQHCEQSRFIEHLISIHDKMYKMEQNKYMQPHYSHLLKSMLIQVSNTQPQLAQPQDQVYFDASIPATKIARSRQEIKNNAKINSIDCFFNEEKLTQPIDKKSISSPKETQGKFRSRIKTNTPEKIEKIQYFTPPQKNIHSEEREYQLPTFNRQDFLKQQYKVKHKASAQRVPKLEKPVRTDISQPLSPREFLRQTMIAKQNGNSFAGLRTKQRHQRKVR